MSIIEIDGPAMAYFLEGEETNIYKSIGIIGRNPTDIVKAMNDTVDAIRDALNDGVIYWRARPHFDVEDREADGVFYRLMCRVTTSPQLSGEFWDSLPYMKTEGDDCVNLDGEIKL